MNQCINGKAMCMGIMDQAREWAERGSELAREHPEQTGQALERAEGTINERTGHKYDRQLDAAGDRASEYLGGSGDGSTGDATTVNREPGEPSRAQQEQGYDRGAPAGQEQQYGQPLGQGANPGYESGSDSGEGNGRESRDFTDSDNFGGNRDQLSGGQRNDSGYSGNSSSDNFGGNRDQFSGDRSGSDQYGGSDQFGADSSGRGTLAEDNDNQRGQYSASGNEDYPSDRSDERGGQDRDRDRSF